MDANSRYPERIIRLLRLRMMLNGNDTHLDDYFQSLSPSHVFLWVLELQGLIIGWDQQIKGWIKGIYDIDLDAISEQSQTKIVPPKAF